MTRGGGLKGHTTHITQKQNNRKEEEEKTKQKKIR
jgi:hypothetical protein